MLPSLAQSSGLLSPAYRAQGAAALQHQSALVTQLLSQRQLPATGWSELQLRALLSEVALMDSNNFVANAGVGEREGRVVSSIVQQRHFHLAHGIGRSGDLLAQQPKAAGSSLLHALTHALTLHAIKLAGLTEAKQVLLLPVATGMSIVLALMALKQQHPSVVRQQQEAQRYAQAVAAFAMADPLQPDAVGVVSSADATAASSSASSVAGASTAAHPAFPSPPSAAALSPLYVIWSRIDQKTCLKSLTAAGLVAVVIELRRVGDQLETDVDAIGRALDRLGGATNVLAVVTTTSCFAPRAPDRVLDVGRLCARHGVAHLVNNAYGIQSATTCALINTAVRRGARIDALVSSMDKNFLTPVGGAVVIGFNNTKEDADKQLRQAQKHQQAKDKRAAASATAAANGAAGSTAASGESSSVSAQPAASNDSSNSDASPPQPCASSSSSSSSSPSPLPNVLDLISSLYPGRASGTPMLDLCLTLLGLGANGWRALLAQREQLYPKLKARMERLAAEQGERVLHTPDNPISLAMTLDRIEPPTHATAVPAAAAAAEGAGAVPAPTNAATEVPSAASSVVGSASPSTSSSSASITDSSSSVSSASSSSSSSSSRRFNASYLGSLLFSRNVSGPRCLSGAGSPAARIGGLQFEHYGTHCGGSSVIGHDTGSAGSSCSSSSSSSAPYPHSYLTAAASIGMQDDEVELFAQRLTKCLAEFHKQRAKHDKAAAAATATAATAPANTAAAAAPSLSSSSATGRL